MPKPAAKARAPRKSTNRRRARTNAPDVIALLKGDHRQVEEWFEQFMKARTDDRKKSIATSICNALKAHTQIEEEIFYPAFLKATAETGVHHEAQIEHDEAKKLIAEIEDSGPGDEYYDAKVKVLSEMIKHHVNEEEKKHGLFAKARSANMDLKGLGERFVERKAQVEGFIANTAPRDCDETQAAAAA